MEDLRRKYKVCSTCKNELSVQEFSRNSRTRDGLRANCKTCARASKHLWYERNKDVTASRMQLRRAVALGHLRSLKEKPCTDCGRRFHFSLMEFDHVGDDKVDSVSYIANTTMSIARIDEEASKCELVCAMCHKVRTWNRMNPGEQINWV